jgi:hypothetical protein
VVVGVATENNNRTDPCIRPGDGIDVPVQEYVGALALCNVGIGRLAMLLLVVVIFEVVVVVNLVIVRICEASPMMMSLPG